MAGITQADLERRLHIGTVDDAELDGLLSGIFPLGQYITDREMVRTNGSATLAIRYSKKGRISGLVPGGAFTEELATQIERDVADKLLVASVSRAARVVLFAHVPVAGYWRYRNRIALRPVPEGSPRPPIELADHPLVCEILFDGAVDPWVNAYRSQREVRKLTLLLTLLVPGLKIPNQSAQGWVLTPSLSGHDFQGPAPVFKSEYAQHGYVPNPIIGPNDSLAPQGELPDMELGPIPIGIVAGAVLTLPEDIEACLDAYFGLSPEDQRVLLRAAYWLNAATDVFHTSRSASFQFLIQAVEALITTPKDQPKCSECDRTIGVGPTALFQDFVGTYAPPTGDSADAGAHKLLYNKRSQLTHGHSLLMTDEETGFMGPGPASMAEMQLHGQAAQVCRSAIVGRLRAHGRDS
ncbi:hypothetical protein ACF9IK_00605 [Kitasatospora hibisci]|uniref:hypothetical protein n=1 Tax=Kitasatospora hibisci TaxID=3369522 RepID=UPI003754AF2D